MQRASEERRAALRKGYLSEPTAVYPGANGDDPAYYAERAAIERAHASAATNEEVASVHENLACRYAALAAGRTIKAGSPKRR